MECLVLPFGMQIEKNKNGDFIISGLVPGGSAWKSNELHKGDKIIKIQPFEQEPLGLNCLDIYDIIDRLSDDLIEKLVITVMKKDGEIKEITLSKEKLEKEHLILSDHGGTGHRGTQAVKNLPKALELYHYVFIGKCQHWRMT